MPSKCRACQHEIPQEAKFCPVCGSKQVIDAPKVIKNNSGTTWGIVIAAITGFIFLLALANHNGAPEKEAPDPMSVLDDRDFNAKNPGFVAGVTALIKSDGYECPALAQLWNKGDSPYGVKLEALCGPDDGSRNALPDLHYSVYPKSLKVVVCKPFSAFGGGCD